MRRLLLLAPFALPLLAPLGARAQTAPRTLEQALALAYATNPTLLAERANLRAVDEGVPQALAGWRPTVTLGGSVGYATGTFRTVGQLAGPDGQPVSAGVVSPQNRPIATGQATLTQPIYRGGATRAATNRAENAVMTERARLIATEQQVFTDAVNAYAGVATRQQLLALQVTNEQVLQRQLDATLARFRVGDITRTDVEQARAAVQGARATRATAEGNLQTATATYVQVIGAPPTNLMPPQPLAVPETAEQATRQAARNNPNVVAALFNLAASKDAVDAAFAALMPTVSAQAQGFRQDNAGGLQQRSIGAQATLNLNVPLYQGGAEYSRIRQTKQARTQADRQVQEQRRTAIAAAVQAFQTLVANRETVTSARAAIVSNKIALQGVEREAIVGSRTTYDILLQQQQLLNSQITLAQNLGQLVQSSYALAAAEGRLTARDLRLPVALYDDTAYYSAVRNALWGVDDAAVGQPGR